MVKAIKRKASGPAGFKTAEESAKEKQDKKTRKIRIFTLLALGLMVLGWTVGSYLGLSDNSQRQQPETIEAPKYGLGTLLGAQTATVGAFSGNRVIYGPLEDPIGLRTRLGGDLYALENDYNALLITNATAETIALNAPGSHILYEIADCGDFDCLIEDASAINMSEAHAFDVYSLNISSQFLKTQNVGFLAEAPTITI
jgi:hypothetical protein